MDNAQLNIQVHGGIGFTWEHDAHLFVRRALVLQALFDPAAAAEDVTRPAAAGAVVERRLDLPAEDDPLRLSVRQRVEAIARLAPDARRPALVDAGYLVPHWPAPWGLGADARLQLTIDAELERAGVERPDMVIRAG